MQHENNRFTHRIDLSRRSWLQVGGLSAFGLGLSDLLVGPSHLLAGQSRKGNSELENLPKGKAKAGILIWLDGGPSHLETFDPKPFAPVEVRGPLQSIATRLPGIRLNECFPKLASMISDFALVRSMTSPLGEHNFGTHYLMTGYQPNAALEYPAYGAVLSHCRSQEGTRSKPTNTRSVLPGNIAIPDFRVGGSDFSGVGFLHGTHQPFRVGRVPARGEFKVQDLDYFQGLDKERIKRRKENINYLDQRFNGQQSTNPKTGSAQDNPYERAYQLITSKEARGAFQINQEKEHTKRRYGFDGGRGSSLGQGCLLARRLVENGVPFVTVNHRGWDTHQNIKNLKERFPNDKQAHLPSVDQAVSGLIGDLKDRGLLDETLVMVMGEFGRTPKINANGGRDHWPKAFSLLLAGGGIRGGVVHGSSDALGEFPKTDPVTPSDLAATVYSALGLDPFRELKTPDGRSVRLAPDGARVISGLFS